MTHDCIIPADELAAMDARANAATAGPWEAESCCGGGYFDRGGERRAGWRVPKAETLGNGECGAMLRVDAAFIAAARTDMPRLLAYVRHLERALDAEDKAHHQSLKLWGEGIDEQDARIAHLERLIRDYVDARSNHPQVAGELFRELAKVVEER